MNALYKNLLQLDHKAFEELCLEIIKERHADANLTRITAENGIDLFLGEPMGQRTVWICKFFNTGIKSPQKTEIKRALRAAIRNFQPKRWILCIPVDLSVNSHAWLQRLRRQYDRRLEIGLLQAFQIVRELLHRTSIRNRFFPGTVLEPAELRSILRRTREFSERELEKLGIENLRQYIQRLRERDTRFNYEIILNPKKEPSPKGPLPGLIVLVKNSANPKPFFPTDIEAIAIDPPNLLCSPESRTASKPAELSGNGQKFQWEPSTNPDPHSGLEFALTSEPEWGEAAAHLASHQKAVSLTLDMGNGTPALRYERLLFEIFRSNSSDLLEMTSSDDKLPFIMSIKSYFPTVLNSRITKITFRTQFVGKEVREVRKFLQAIRALKETGRIEIRNASTGGALLSLRMAVEGSPAVNDSLLAFLNDVCEVLDTFEADLSFPQTIKPDDRLSVGFLLSLSRTGQSLTGVRGVSCSLVKGSHDQTSLLDALDGEIGFEFLIDRVSPKPRIFGTEIDTGECVLIIEHAFVVDRPRALREYQRAEAGDDVILRFSLPEAPKVFLTEALPATWNTTAVRETEPYSPQVTPRTL